ncbi:MAG TPA: lipid-binding SYLF domain-containing protein [Thermoanaerobaculia bacterium]|nr:lipid-binding SYLF domain-containing protein [Thermoanaerobaculia bacterium]
MFSSRTRSVITLALIAVCLGMTASVFAADRPEDQQLVIQARQTFDRFVQDPDFTWIRKNRQKALGYVIVPKVVKAAFILGGSGGHAVLVVKGDKGWMGPAFYNLGTASAGLQVGISNMEGVMFIMTKKGLDSLMSSSMKFGADASIAVGPVGSGAAGDADFVVFMRAKGAYAGANINGTVISPNDGLNKEHYGKDVSPIDIVVKGSVKNKADAPLLAAVAK